MRSLCIVLLAVVIVFAISCAPSVSVKHDYDKEANFASLKTYDWLPVPTTAVGNVKAAIERIRETLRQRPARTDAKGTFQFDGLQAGDSYRISATKKGYSRAGAGPFAIKPGTVRNDLELKLDASAALQVRLVDAHLLAVLCDATDVHERYAVLGVIELGR